MYIIYILAGTIEPPGVFNMNEVGLSLPQDVGIKDRTMVWLGIPRILTGIRMAITHGVMVVYKKCMKFLSTK